MYYQFLTSPLATCGVTDYPRFPDVSFTVGSRIGRELPLPLQFPVDATAQNPPPDFTELVIPAMSDRLVAALREAGVDNLQCFDAVLQNPETGESWKGYQAVNIIGCTACADLSRSEYTEIGGGLLGFSWLVVDPKLARGALFFRLAESPSMIIAHRSIGDHLYAAGQPRMSGFRFWPAAAEDVAKLRKEVGSR